MIAFFWADVMMFVLFVLFDEGKVTPLLQFELLGTCIYIIIIIISIIYNVRARMLVRKVNIPQKSVV